eukprot:COSAG04_NODE_1099_length_8265_cov_7.395053_6_plen_222_part_00
MNTTTVLALHSSLPIKAPQNNPRRPVSAGRRDGGRRVGELPPTRGSDDAPAQHPGELSPTHTTLPSSRRSRHEECREGGVSGGALLVLTGAAGPNLRRTTPPASGSSRSSSRMPTTPARGASPCSSTATPTSGSRRQLRPKRRRACWRRRWRNGRAPRSTSTTTRCSARATSSRSRTSAAPASRTTSPRSVRPHTPHPPHGPAPPSGVCRWLPTCCCHCRC